MTPAEADGGDGGRLHGQISKLVGVAFRSGAPAVLFVAVAAFAPVCVAAPAAVAMALAIVAVQWSKCRSATSALAGLGITVFCAGAVIFTGETRDFFLLPMAIPFGAVLLCLATIILKRPLVGVIVNPLAFGPNAWTDQARLRQLYANATWLCIAINIANGGAQVIFYAQEQAAMLAIIHAATGPVFALVMLVTGVRARRIIYPR
jgi:hypothetical protein